MKKRAVPAPTPDPLCIPDLFSLEAGGDAISYGFFMTPAKPVS